jgi:hypothetical protein
MFLNGKSMTISLVFVVVVVDRVEMRVTYEEGECGNGEYHGPQVLSEEDRGENEPCGVL